MPDNHSLVIGLLVALLGGCAREAPGPMECQRFAQVVVGLRDERALASPRVRALFEEEVTKCLTTPYDQKLLRCVEERGPRGSCLVEFQRRHGGQSLPDPLK
jgi:hypothetical protein